MRTLTHELGTINVPGPDDDLSPLYRLAEDSRFSADTETTGKNPYAPGFRVRLVQMGISDQAWILRPGWHDEAIAKLTSAGPVQWHNFVYDAIALEVSEGLSFEGITENAVCTDTISRVLDPRGRDKGGVGHKLEDLAYVHIGSAAKKDAKKELLAEGRRLKLGANAENIFAKIPVDNEVYLLYAGQDVFSTARLAEVLRAQAESRALTKLVTFEHRLARRVGDMRRVGLLFDAEFAGKAEAELDAEFAEAERRLSERWGLKKTATYVHSSKKVLQARFVELGVTWTKFSEKTSAPSLDADVLMSLVLAGGEPGELARDILVTKRAKHYGDYIRGMRAVLGTDGRIHPNIQPLAAATARMSISDPAAQQWPRADKRIRGCIHADAGQVLISSDYAQIEFRVAAALSRDPVMMKRILQGEDLHAVTARALFGPEFTKDQRQTAKPVGFGRLFLGGPRGIRQQMAEADPWSVPPLEDVERAVGAFDRSYRGMVRWGRQEIKNVETNGCEIVTATGRPLIVEKAYKVINYQVQSVARDILASAVGRLHRAGYGPHLRLLVHDEVLSSVPQEQAEEALREIPEVMGMTFKGIPIIAEAEDKGERWSK